MKTKIILMLIISAMCVWAGDRSPAPTTGSGSRALTPRRTDRPVYEKLTFVPGFAGCSFYFPAADGKAIEVTFREAGNQSVEGKRAVIEVILNRVKTDVWPDTVELVLSQPRQFMT